MDTEAARGARELDSTLDAGIDLDELKNGGPTRTPGIRTTTGGTAGPASTAGLRTRSPAAGPTTGDAGSSGMDASAGGSTSDATTTDGSGPVGTGESGDRRH
ncbi:MAG TPA: hypothetical protein VNV66_08435 [Pilimelia sp.]|nr:hypothetical protein [Pilimelia sp.]